MVKRIIKTDQAPGAIGPYSQAVEANGTLYCSGQIAIDPVTGELRTESIEEETHQIMKNVSAVLQAAGYGLENVVKTSIFLSSMENFSSVNDVYASYFESDYPARETVEVSALPKYVNVEISVLAVK